MPRLKKKKVNKGRREQYLLGRIPKSASACFHRGASILTGFRERCVDKAFYGKGVGGIPGSDEEPTKKKKNRGRAATEKAGQPTPCD